jgi:hypothetical protein
MGFLLEAALARRRAIRGQACSSCIPLGQGEFLTGGAKVIPMGFW